MRTLNAINMYICNACYALDLLWLIYLTILCHNFITGLPLCLFVLFSSSFSLSFDADILCCDDSLCSIDALWTKFLNSPRTHTIIYLLILFDDKWIFIEHNSLIKGKKGPRTPLTMFFFSFLFFYSNCGLKLWHKKNNASNVMVRLNPSWSGNEFVCAVCWECVCVFFWNICSIK